MAKAEMQERRRVLPGSIIPLHYALKMYPNNKTFRYSGSVIIQLNVKKAVRAIRLNAGELSIKRAFLYQRQVKLPAKIAHDKKEQLLTLSFSRKASGHAELAIDFEGTHNDRLVGFYRSTYTVKGRKEKHYNLSTHFEPADARTAFPCFDQPDMKARFSVSMVVPKELEAISNMPIKSISPAEEKGKKLVVFETTPLMSTYLVYMGAGRYEGSAGKYRGIPLRVLATPGKRNLTITALSYLKKLLTHYERYFGIKYALPKLDLIAMPDFAMGAMENWGAITFRETALLMDPKDPSVGSKERVSMVLAHELAHQWFGDLVTMKWWDEIWLNESFAEFMGFKSVDAIFPDWGMMKRYKVEAFIGGRADDQLRSTHPIKVRVNTPTEVGGIFDAISYNKGGAVLYMLESLVGKEAFRKGLHNYLSAHKYGNGSGEDLWNSIQKASNADGGRLPVSRIMKSWIEKPGFPIIEVRKGYSFELSQKRFTLSKEYDDGPWPIAVNYLSEKGAGRYFIDKREGVIKDDSPWIKLNYGQSGFYGVRYDEGLIRKIGELIRSGELSADDAWGVESDVFGDVRTGRIGVQDYLDFVSRYCMECGYPANAAIMGHLGWLNNMFDRKPLVYNIRNVAISFSGAVLKKTGWERGKNEDNTTALLRGGAIVSLGRMGDRETLLKARAMSGDFMRNS